MCPYQHPIQLSTQINKEKEPFLGPPACLQGHYGIWPFNARADQTVLLDLWTSHASPDHDTGCIFWEFKCLVSGAIIARTV